VSAARQADLPPAVRAQRLEVAREPEAAHEAEAEAADAVAGAVAD